uniref:Uncharacterized protein n=1 Tax=Romanomermis culicivorax TaxID=13658 RepID=A0A915KXV9_ROMCU
MSILLTSNTGEDFPIRKKLEFFLKNSDLYGIFENNLENSICQKNIDLGVPVSVVNGFMS